jgi:hypothetical protein
MKSYCTHKEKIKIMSPILFPVLHQEILSQGQILYEDNVHNTKSSYLGVKILFETFLDLVFL